MTSIVFFVAGSTQRPPMKSLSRSRIWTSRRISSPIACQHMPRETKAGTGMLARMETEKRDVPTPDGPMRVYVAHPDEQPSRAVIVIQEAYGVNEHIEDVTRRIASAGYLGVAPDLF